MHEWCPYDRGQTTPARTVHEWCPYDRGQTTPARTVHEWFPYDRGHTTPSRTVHEWCPYDSPDKGTKVKKKNSSKKCTQYGYYTTTMILVKVSRMICTQGVTALANIPRPNQVNRLPIATACTSTVPVSEMHYNLPMPYNQCILYHIHLLRYIGCHMTLLVTYITIRCAKWDTWSREDS